MSDLEILTGKGYLSHSSLSSYLDCGERFRLERIAKVPQQKAWYLVGGSAFHTATEWLDGGEQDDPTLAWKLAWEQQCEKELAGINPADVRAGGRKSKDWPNKENADWWEANGPRLVDDYSQWISRKLAEGWSWFMLPNGKPAIEVGVELDLSSVVVKGYIDRVMVNPDGELMVIDLKTGSHTPAASLQLGIYAIGVERHFGVKPILGAYYMARKVDLSEPVSLLHYTPELVDSWFASVKTGIEAGVFVPHVTSMCGSCSVRPYCVAFPAPKPTNIPF